MWPGSSRTHFYALLCEIVSVQRKAVGESKDRDEGPIAVHVRDYLGHVAMRAGNGSEPGRIP